jgi:hypothetical protein
MPRALNKALRCSALTPEGRQSNCAEELELKTATGRIPMRGNSNEKVLVAIAGIFAKKGFHWQSQSQLSPVVA